MGITLDESQQAAVDLIVSQADTGGGLVVVTGGPGTGKTTTMRQALLGLYAAGVDAHSIAIAAPTGKAAIRITEQVTDVFPHEATTIHRLLGVAPTGGAWQFSFHEANRHPASYIIVDEASMIDVPLMASLMEAMRDDATLVLVGDVDQLPSVGPGQVFRDLINSRRVPVARLTVNHRQLAGSLIANGAVRVLAGRQPVFGVDGGNTLGGTVGDDMFWHQGDEHNDVLAHVLTILDGYAEAGRDAELPIVLCPQHTLAIGVKAFNTMLQDRYNPEKPHLTPFRAGDKTIRPGDPVLHTRNNYKLQVFNGEVGRFVGKQGDGWGVDYPGKGLVEYPYDVVVGQLDLAYAMTVHKSQGSEYPAVVFICHSSNHYMLSRNLLYTAMTRAKRRLHIVGNQKGIARAVTNGQTAARNTSLIERITSEAA